MITCPLNHQTEPVVCVGAWQPPPSPATGQPPRPRDDQPTRTVAIRFGRAMRWTVPVEVNTPTARRK